MPLFPSYGGAAYSETSKKVIRLVLHGCVNRPFYHISVLELYRPLTHPVIEQLGSYDPLPNQFNEKLVAINFQRLEHWLRQGALCSAGVKRVLGFAGYFPIHPKTYVEAWSNRKKISQTLEELRASVAAINASSTTPTEALPEPTVVSTSQPNEERSPEEKS